jgi:phage-related holin
MNTKLFIMAFFMMPVFRFVEKYVWDDWSFLMFMTLLIMIDTATGMVYAWKEHNFSSKRMQSLVIKVFVYGATLVTIHIITAFTVKNRPDAMMADFLPYMDSLMYSFLVFREVLSINENMGKLGYPMLPKFILKRFADFDENGLAKKPETNIQNNTDNTQPKV